MEREVGELAAQNAKVKVTSPANTMERRFSVWLGAPLHTLTCFVDWCWDGMGKVGEPVDRQ